MELHFPDNARINTYDFKESIFIHYQLADLQRKQDEAFRAVSLRKLLAGGSDSQDTSEL